MLELQLLKNEDRTKQVTRVESILLMHTLHQHVHLSTCLLQVTYHQTDILPKSIKKTELRTVK